MIRPRKFSIGLCKFHFGYQWFLLRWSRWKLWQARYHHLLKVSCCRCHKGWRWSG